MHKRTVVHYSQPSCNFSGLALAKTYCFRLPIGNRFSPGFSSTISVGIRTSIQPRSASRSFADRGTSRCWSNSCLRGESFGWSVGSARASPDARTTSPQRHCVGLETGQVVSPPQGPAAHSRPGEGGRGRLPQLDRVHRHNHSSGTNAHADAWQFRRIRACDAPGTDAGRPGDSSYAGAHRRTPTEVEPRATKRGDCDGEIGT